MPGGPVSQRYQRVPASQQSPGPGFTPTPGDNRHTKA
jgi:hypothetical protein